MISKLLCSGGNIGTSPPPPENVIYTDSFTGTASSGTTNFHNINIGAESSNRNIIVVLGFANLSVLTKLTGVTVNGVSLDLYLGTDGGSDPIKTAIAKGLVTTGTSVTISITSGESADVFAAVYSYDAPSTTLSLVDNVSNSELINSNASLDNVAIQSGGVLFYGCSDRGSNSTSTVTWTGADAVNQQTRVIGFRVLHHGFIECTETTTADDLLISIGGTDKVARQAVSFI